LHYIRYNFLTVGSVNISLITVTFNAANTIEKCIKSVIAQSYPNVEYIIIDACSTDATISIINRYKNHVHHLISEPDKGIYDGMNKGIALATGDIIGIINADDHFADDHILTHVARAFQSSGADIIYGDIDYIDKKNKIIRKWRSGVYKPGHFNRGWMPPHPSFYAKRQLFDSFGKYDLQYGSATDYELMLRFIHTHNIKVHYINKVMVRMLVGGVSNQSIGNRINAWQNDYRAMKRNRLALPYISIVLKPFRKIIQYLR